MILSVILPVFNNENTLENCILSLIEQRFQDFEIIVVDDGSTDESRKKAELLLEGRGNSSIVSQENQGVSAARNNGLIHANGEWVAFVDSDDTLAPDCLERMMAAAKDVDLVVSGIVFLKGDKETHRMLPPDDEWVPEDLIRNKAHYLDYTTSVCGRLFRKELIDKYLLRFDECLQVAEDRDFNIEYLAHAERVRFVSYAGYYYQTAHAGSLSKERPAHALSIDVSYWNKMSRLLDGTNEAYLAHRLFYFLVDSVSCDLQRNDYFKAIRSLNEVRPFLDRSFLRCNMKSVPAPAWQKALVRFYLG